MALDDDRASVLVGCGPGVDTGDMQRTLCLVWAAACMLVACESDPVAAGGACEQTSECVKGLECKRGKCTAVKPQPVVEEEPPPREGPMRVLDDAKKAEDVTQGGVDRRMKEILGEPK